MKWAWAFIFAAGMLVGCRSAQPTANPFIRTTVPPPGTGQGAVVVPGEQYYPSGAPPVATTAPPPVVAPIAPPPPGMVPPPGAPPVVIPPKDKYSPPGGSFQYNQSSNDRSRALDSDDSAGGVSLAAYSAPHEPTQETAMVEDVSPEHSDAVNQAVMLAAEADSQVVPTEGPRKSRPLTGGIVPLANVAPRELRALADGESQVTVDAMRILSGSDSDEPPLDDEVAGRPAAQRDAALSMAAVEPRVRSLAQPAARKVASAMDEAPEAPE